MRTGRVALFLAHLGPAEGHRRKFGLPVELVNHQVAADGLPNHKAQSLAICVVLDCATRVQPLKFLDAWAGGRLDVSLRRRSGSAVARSYTAFLWSRQAEDCCIAALKQLKQQG